MRLKLTGLIVAAFSFAAAQSAFAADMPVKAPAYAPPVSWTGFYAGLQAGYGWHDISYSFGTSNTLNMKGFVGGGTVGYNWQAGAFVVGLESDISFADVKGSALNVGIAPCSIQGCEAKLNWFSTGRARLGYAIGNLLPYLTGGVALGGVKGSADNGACGNIPCFYDETRWGWTVGGGLEYRLYGNWSLKAEYLYLNLGKPSFTSPFVLPTDFAVNIVRGGVNLHF